MRDLLNFRKNRKRIFRIVELGTVTTSTKGVSIYPILDGGAPPFNKEYPV